MFRGLVFILLIFGVHLFADVEREPNGSYENALNMYNNVTYEGDIKKSYDTDFYKATVEGDAFNLSFQTQEMNMNYHVYILNQEREQIEYFNIKKGQSGVNITLGVNPGLVYIKITAYNQGNTSGAYSVKVSGLGRYEISQSYEVQPNGSLENVQEISEGIPYVAYISKSYDTDYFKLNLNSGNMHLYFKTQEMNMQYYVYVYNQEHQQIKYFNVRKGVLELDETFGVNGGVVYIKVTAYNQGNTFGEYQLTINPGTNPLPLPNPNPTGTDTLLSNVLHTDQLIYGIYSMVRDGCFARKYTINVQQSTNVEISLDSNDFDTYLTLFDQYGSELMSNDDYENSTNSKISTYLSAGTYIVEATSYYPNTSGGFTIMYSNNIVAPAIDQVSDDDDLINLLNSIFD